MAKRTKKQGAGEVQPKAPRSLSPERRSALQDDAFEAGSTAHAKGASRDASEAHYPPADDVHSLNLVQHWQQGWDAADVAVHRGGGVLLLYSRIPAALTDPEACIAAARNERAGAWSFDERDIYPPLPFAMGDLPGSTWVNLWTGSRVTIAAIKANGWGKAVPVEAAAIAHPTPGSTRRRYGTLGIGPWSGNRYIIEHWVRFDSLPPETQLRWLLIPLRRAHGGITTARAQIRDYDAAPQRVSCYSTNRNMRLNEIARGKEALASALETVRRFADQHGLFVSPDLLNAAILGEADEQPSDEEDWEEASKGDWDEDENEGGEEDDGEGATPVAKPAHTPRTSNKSHGEAVQLYLL